MIYHNINYSTKYVRLKVNYIVNQLFTFLRDTSTNIITIIFILFFNTLIFSQNFNLDNYYNNQTIINDSIIKSYNENNKYKFLNLIPSISYDVLNDSFNVGFSLNNLSNYLQNKQKNKIELAKLQATLTDRLNNNIDKINIDIEVYNNEYNLLKYKIKDFSIIVDLFKINQGKYNNSEITTEEYLKLKLNFNNKYTSLISSIYSLKLKLSRINSKLKKSELSKSPLDSLTIILINKNNIQKKRI